MVLVHDFKCFEYHNKPFKARRVHFGMSDHAVRRTSTSLHDIQDVEHFVVTAVRKLKILYMLLFRIIYRATKHTDVYELHPVS
jgi:hypothetical protein